MSRLLLLSDWRITVQNIEDSENVAEVEFQEHGEATINLCPKFYKASKEEQRETILHELLHIHLRRISEVMEGTEGCLGKKAYSILHNSYTAAEEGTVQTLARILAPNYPLPS